MVISDFVLHGYFVYKSDTWQVAVFISQRDPIKNNE